MKQHATKLHALLDGKTRWDDATWFQVERYLLENTSRTGMLRLVSLAGVEPTGAARHFKTDAVKLLRQQVPGDVLAAWGRLRAER